jgi:hypothetical protein
MMAGKDFMATRPTRRGAEIVPRYGILVILVIHQIHQIDSALRSLVTEKSWSPMLFVVSLALHSISIEFDAKVLNF